MMLYLFIYAMNIKPEWNIFRFTTDQEQLYLYLPYKIKFLIH